MKSITYIVSNIDKAVAFEWIIREINTQKFNLSFILLNSKSSALESYIRKAKIKYYCITLDSKKHYPKAVMRTHRKLKILNPDIVHCHMREANFIGLSAAKLLGIKKRIYTRHFSTYNHQFHPKSVKFDLAVNALATDIVAISQNVKKVLINRENVDPNKISLIHHGFDLAQFRNPPYYQVDALREEHDLEDKWPVIGVVARYIDWKGHQYIIDAFAQLLEKYPNAQFIFANAQGPHKNDIQKMLKDKIPNNHIEIEFEKDLFSLYKLFDIYVHTPIDKKIEAFGQTYIEALAAHIPSIFTLSGVANEFIKDGYNALVVPHQNSSEIANSVIRILENEKLKYQLIENGLKSINKYRLSRFIKRLETLYA